MSIALPPALWRGVPDRILDSAPHPGAKAANFLPPGQDIPRLRSLVHLAY